jgi:hypothetical protein
MKVLQISKYLCLHLLSYSRLPQALHLHKFDELQLHQHTGYSIATELEESRVVVRLNIVG